MFTVILLFITQEITLTNHIGASLANLCMPTKNVCVTEDYSDTQGYLSSVLFTHSLPLHHSQLHWHSPLVSPTKTGHRFIKINQNTAKPGKATCFFLVILSCIVWCKPHLQPLQLALIDPTWSVRPWILPTGT